MKYMFIDFCHYFTKIEYYTNFSITFSSYSSTPENSSRSPDIALIHILMMALYNDGTIMMALISIIY